MENLILAVGNRINVKVYPNPVENRLQIELSNMESEGIVELVDVQGRTVLSVPLISKFVALDCSEIKTGMYVLKIQSGEALFIQNVFRQ